MRYRQLLQRISREPRSGFIPADSNSIYGLSLRSTSHVLLADTSPGHAPSEYTTAKKRALQRAFPMNASATKARGFTHSVQARDRLAVTGAQHTALHVSLDSAQTLARENEFANSDQRSGFAIKNWLEVAGTDAVSTVSAEVGDSAQLFVVVICRTPGNHLIPRLDRPTDLRAIKPQPV